MFLLQEVAVVEELHFFIVPFRFNQRFSPIASFTPQFQLILLCSVEKKYKTVITGILTVVNSEICMNDF